MMLIIMFCTMLTALGIVREKELGSITNLYAAPASKLEFLLGKQLPYIGIGLVSFVMLVLVIVFAFRVPMTGSFLALAAGRGAVRRCRDGLRARHLDVRALADRRHLRLRQSS